MQHAMQTSDAPETFPYKRQALWLQAALAVAGMALIAAFAIGEPGFPDATPPRWGVALIAGVYALFCALEARLFYLGLTSSNHIGSRLVRVGLSLLIVSLFSFIQIFALIIALIFWPIWLLVMVGVLVSALWALRRDHVHHRAPLT